MPLLNVLNKPYPFSDDPKYNAKAIFFISIGIFLFLWLFQPFDTDALPVRTKYYLFLGFSFITFLTLSIYLLLIPSLFPKRFSSSNWNIKKEILWNWWILFTILVGYFFFAQYLDAMKYNFYMVIKLVIIAVIPITLLIIVNHNKMLRTHMRRAEELNRQLKDHKQSMEKIIHFKSEYQKDSLAINVNSLMVIRSADNYIEVFWKDIDKIRSQMVRCSMAAAEETVKEHKIIFKCHRSYMINITYIERFEGNSQGYKLYFENFPFPIPVSKNLVGKLQDLI